MGRTIEVIANNSHGLSQRVLVTPHFAYDLLFKLTGDGTVRDYSGTHEGTQYIIRRKP